MNENARRGQDIAWLVATDPDEGINGAVNYQITPSSSTQLFDVGTTTGETQLQARLVVTLFALIVIEINT